MPQSRRSSLYVRKASTFTAPIRELELHETYNSLKSLTIQEATAAAALNAGLPPAVAANGSNVGGRFGVCVFEAEDRKNKTKIALKIFQKKAVKQVDFFREYNYSYFLSPHPNIVETYEGVYTTKESYFFVQEFCPLGNLENITATYAAANSYIEESQVRLIIGQLISALEFLHCETLVHRNVCAKSILVFSLDFSRVKLSNFGSARKEGTIVKHTRSNNLYDPPEICDTLKNEAYGVDYATDIWATGILIFYLLRSRYPWSKATFTCKPYYEWEQWQKRKSAQLPPKWVRFSEKALKLFKRTLEVKAKNRCSAKGVKKFLNFKWLKEIKSSNSVDPLIFVDDSSEVTKSRSNSDINKRRKKKSVLQQWIAATISTMTEISEQVVSATE
uniref:Protein kinase domain-containing protein n=1 Tax=Romanomermis culicivorax TaxID=13658 RepID=A0A915KB21_ROMCU